MHAKRSIQRKTGQQCRPQTTWSAETAVFVTLGLVAIAAIVLAVGSSSIPATTQLSAAAQKSPVVKYLRSGQLVADARTLASIAHYIMEPEPATNGKASGPRQSILSFTNNASGEPKV